MVNQDLGLISIPLFMLNKLLQDSQEASASREVIRILKDFIMSREYLSQKDLLMIIGDSTNIDSNNEDESKTSKKEKVFLNE